MLKNVTLTAEEALIERARALAQRRHTTLNEEFRTWLARYAGRNDESDSYLALMGRLSYARAGGRFTRDEMNER
ncbi:MAG: hypothetical protein HY900_38300 [Deltaproteobacteria bacterium]|nr:hypothetical protein [Deltaproteobacteria bacterium]